MRSTVPLSVAALLLASATAECPYAKRADYDPFDSYALGVPSHLLPRQEAPPPPLVQPATGKSGVMTFSRLAPGESILYIANSDGSDIRQLLGDQGVFESHASFSQDGQYITFTSERAGSGNADIWRVRADGSDLQQLVASPSVEDQGVLSPDNSKLAYVSSAESGNANIWVLDIASGEKTCLTNTNTVAGVPWSPNGYFKPAWSPDGEWLVFSSDRNTAWTSHANGTRWENTQELSIYAMRPDGTDFRQVIRKDGYALGSPKWSPDGKRIVFYQIEREGTYAVRRPPLWNTTSTQLYTVDFATGQDLRQETSDNSIKLAPQYVADGFNYVVRGMPGAGLWNKGSKIDLPPGPENACWSPDGAQVVFEVPFTPYANLTAPTRGPEVYSPDPDWDYRVGEQFPSLSQQGLFAHASGNRNVLVVSNPSGANPRNIFNNSQVRDATQYEGPLTILQTAWSPDGEWIAFGAGGYFNDREKFVGWIYRIRADGSDLQRLTDGSLNAGYPSYSKEGDRLVYRVWGKEYGLRILDLGTNETSILTTDTLNDNLPGWSPDGELIVFTRRMNETNFDVCTIRPDGSDLRVLTSSGANDGHAVWTYDNKILYSTGEYGWKTEAASYASGEQPYGNIWIMDRDGENKRQLTDSLWEDGTPVRLLNEVLG